MGTINVLVFVALLTAFGQEAPRPEPAQPRPGAAQSQPAPTTRPAAAQPKPGREVDLSKHFGAFDGAFVLYDVRRDAYLRHNPRRCAQRFAPCSTYKIPNALIGLETGVLSGPEHEFKWDGVKRWSEDWNHDHTLRTAIRDSVLWYFQEVARQVGQQRMQEWVDRLDYGNRDISGGLTEFWLGSSLLISADEQLEFVRRLQRCDLPASARSQELLRDMLLYRRDGQRAVYGKTGTYGKDGKITLGWYVGWLVRGDQVYIFATNMSGQDQAWGPKAREITIAILDELVPGSPSAAGSANQKPDDAAK